jgi:hypothetical protein
MELKIIMIPPFFDLNYLQSMHLKALPSMEQNVEYFMKFIEGYKIGEVRMQ